MKTLKSLIFIFILVCAWFSSADAFEKTAKFSVIVVDDNGNPVGSAKVGVGFERNFNARDSIGHQQESDSNGKATFSDSTSGYVTYGAKKEGYYNSYYSYTFTKVNTFRWIPWNPELTVVLRKIKNPVPMYARRAKIKIPVVGKDVGFDLIKYDWVTPYGKGIHSDFIFNLSRNFTAWDEQDCELNIKVSNKYDGIQLDEEDRKYGSVFKLKRYAPDSNYKNIIHLFIHAHNGIWKSNVKETDNYYFRIRCTEKNEKFIQAMYGKIVGELDFSPINTKTAIIVFDYYLNPDYSQNLEFDPKRNLFVNLSEFEQITAP